MKDMGLREPEPEEILASQIDEERQRRIAAQHVSISSTCYVEHYLPFYGI